ncbi:5-(carboxyamino)imidazole ribonucleotide synthase [Aeoliella sp. ICT_H6.2]|uniref:N5-carboxyaminoimidazole ribonucleotide synthase n=1 Tax=Aeoliella straminimaris TaxID=2954799 RepID=A0A9X2F647_9BACT|nr:5-(carboxyamino)imidazole ribonucleotide synthase [Aeoliella straminimaris]MCO6042947.1 5-(carboxyamino)imidazole ribonucleotide synthase [Aeoliella straminimaris]
MSLPPNSTLGVFGGGQLGQMFATAAQELGYRVHVYCPESDCPASQVADEHTVADYHDFQAIAKFAQAIDAATLEFENVPVAAAEAAAHFVPVRPAGEALYTVQDRSREKGFLTLAGIATTPFRNVRSADELNAAVEELGTPAVLKTTKFGYDGKGQTIIQQAAETEKAWSYLGRHKCVLEQFIEFEREISVLVARDTDGNMATFGPMENAHANHILDVSVYPAKSPERAARAAIDAARQVAVEIDLVGLACVEFFETPAGEVMVNEIAPRPHNSGHLTIEACSTSQFAQQARTVAGLPVAEMTAPRPAAMANLLGDLWATGEPNWEAVQQFPGVELHLYGKHTAREGRKMGHLTAVADTPAEAERLVREARAAVVR